MKVFAIPGQRRTWDNIGPTAGHVAHAVGREDGVYAGAHGFRDSGNCCRVLWLTASKFHTPDMSKKTAKADHTTDHTTVKIKVGPFSEDKHAEKLHQFGVSWNWIYQFTMKNNCWDYTTRDVVEKIIKPATQKKRCRYAELDECVKETGPASVFVSHCWSANWGDLVSAICSKQTRRMWIDVFAVKQHGDNTADMCFRKIIPKCNVVVVVVSTRRFKGLEDVETYEDFLDETEEAKEQNAFFRLWCIVEMASAIHNQKPVVVQAGKSMGDSHEFDYGKDEVAFKMLQGIAKMVRIEEAECSVAQDKVEQMRLILQEDGGFKRVNRTLQGIVNGALYARNDTKHMRDASPALTNDLIQLFCGEVKITDFDAAKQSHLLTVASACAYTQLLNEILVAVPTINRLTALRCAAQEGQTGVIKRMLNDLKDTVRNEYLTDDCNVAAVSGFESLSLLGAACTYERYETARYLVQANAKMNSGELYTLLQEGCQKGWVDIVAILLVYASRTEVEATSVQRRWRPASKGKTRKWTEFRNYICKFICTQVCYRRYAGSIAHDEIERDEQKSMRYRRHTISAHQSQNHMKYKRRKKLIIYQKPLTTGNDSAGCKRSRKKCQRELCENEEGGLFSTKYNHCRKCGKFICKSCSREKNVFFQYELESKVEESEEIICTECETYGDEPHQHYPYLGEMRMKLRSNFEHKLLHAAKRGRTEELAKLLLSDSKHYNADFVGVAGNICGTTLLGQACLSGHPDIIRLLLILGADVRKKSGKPGQQEYPVEHVVKKYLEHGHERHRKAFEALITVGYLQQYSEASVWLEKILKQERWRGQNIVFWDNVDKINKRGEVQERTFVITAKHMYNFKPNRFCKYQRKIALEDITKVFAAKSSLSVLIKVPHEYDYYVHLKEKESFDEFIEVMEKSVDIEFTTDAELKPLATNNADKSSMGSPRPNRYKHAPSALEYASRQSEREMKKRGCTVCHTESKGDECTQCSERLKRLVECLREKAEVNRDRRNSFGSFDQSANRPRGKSTDGGILRRSSSCFGRGAGRGVEDDSSEIASLP